MSQPASDTRTLLLEAALECFALYGFEGTSIRMVADRAGRPLSLISHHFGGKEGLYVEVFRQMLAAFQQRCSGEPCMREKAPETREAALQLLRSLIRFLYTDSAIKRQGLDPAQECGSVLWLREFRSPRPALRELIQAYLSPLAEQLKATIGILRPGMSIAETRFVGITILGMINGHSMMHGLNGVVWGEETEGCDPLRDADRLVELCLRGLELPCVPGPG